LKIFLAGERDLEGYFYMKWIKNRLMTYYYHGTNGKISKDLNNWLKLIQRQQN
tara:strand:+ start:421 stop:579 length:159 start_codon:yes stop_codon:yes gene_type:complete